jgi:hypothetical protein
MPVGYATHKVTCVVAALRSRAVSSRVCKPSQQNVSDAPGKIRALGRARPLVFRVLKGNVTCLCLPTQAPARSAHGPNV